MALQRKVTVPKSLNLDVNADTLKNVTNHPINLNDDTTSSNFLIDNDLAKDSKNNSNEYLSNSENNENIGSNNTKDRGVTSRLSEFLNSNLPGIEKSINSYQTDLIQDDDSDDNNDEMSYKNERSQNSNSDDQFHRQLTRNAPTSLSGNRKAIKKTKVSIENYFIMSFVRIPNNIY